MSFPFGQAVTVWLEQRSRVGDVTVTDERVVRGCSFTPRSGDEAVGQRSTVTAGGTLYTPPNAGITAKHRVRLADGTTWEVEGEPGHWDSALTGWAAGAQVELRRVTG